MLNKDKLAYFKVRNTVFTARFMREDDDDDGSGMSWRYKIIAGLTTCIGDMLWVSPEGWMEGYTFKTTVTNNLKELTDG